MDGALILAGGRSTRMGRDKAWLELDGRTLLEHVLGVVGSCCRPIVISARPGQALPRWQLELIGAIELAEQIERVDDPIADAGPLEGVLAGLERLAVQGVARAYIGSCDAAALSVEHVVFMLAQLDRAPTAIMAVPVDHEHLHPLASAVRVPGMLAHVRALHAAGERRLRALAETPALLRIDASQLPHPAVLAPCNTPEQWRALMRPRT